MERRFPPGFLFGTATSATQVEGGCTSSDWYRFSTEPGRVAHGDTPLTACEHWERWRDDVELQAELGLSAHRLSLEWARIEPEEGRFDHAALDRYREELAALRERGITPMVTLHHFTFPCWLADKGGVLCPELPRLMERYAERVADALSDLCSLWITVNEPKVLVVAGYLFGIWPPARVGRLDEAILGVMRLLEAHTRCYRALHRVAAKRGHEAQVGVAHHLRVVQPRDPAKRRDRLAALTMDRFFNETFTRTLLDGVAFGPLDRALEKATGFSPREAKGTQDFFGLNYYSRDIVHFAPAHVREAGVRREVPAGCEQTMLGWEVYPQGLTELLVHWHERAHLPFFITENGIATEDDAQRCRFLLRHLAALLDARDKGVQVRGYFHWSLLDNFEWHEGYAPRFGLVEVDYHTQRRRPRESARLYAEIVRRGALDDELLARHLGAEAA